MINIRKKCNITVQFDNGSKRSFVEEVEIGTYGEIENQLVKFIRNWYGEIFFHVISVKDCETGDYIN